jgi:MFS-type transporter involved in bile tolerance (Atg22 family)
MNRGLGDALSRAFEFAATLGLCVVIGLFLDRKFGTTPLFMIGLSIFSLVGQFIKLWYAYDAEMKRHEAVVPSRLAHAEQAATSQAVGAGQ